MNVIKKIFGVVCILAAPYAIYFLISTAISEIEKKPVIDTKVQWVVFIVVFIPIAIGLILFGLYALKGEYDRLPESSAEIQD
jgi:hypothetical protein